MDANVAVSALLKGRFLGQPHQGEHGANRIDILVILLGEALLGWGRLPNLAMLPSAFHRPRHATFLEAEIFLGLANDGLAFGDGSFCDLESVKRPCDHCSSPILGEPYLPLGQVFHRGQAIVKAILRPWAWRTSHGGKSGADRVAVHACGRGLPTCGFCHSDGGRVAGRGPQLMNTQRSDDFIRNRIKMGKEGAMPAFGVAFSDAQIDQIIKYIRSLKPREG